MIGLGTWIIGVAALLAPNTENRWGTDYTNALQQAQQESRPLLVVLVTPELHAAPTTQVSLKAGTAEATLLKNYKLCRIDVTTPYGQKMAKAFAATSFPFTSIIDRTGKVQIFRKAGQFSHEEWEATLVDYKSGVSKPVQTASSQRSRACRT